MEAVIGEILAMLDSSVSSALLKAVSGEGGSGSLCINEIRLRRNRRMSLTTGNMNKTTELICSEALMLKTFDTLCRGSLHAHMETIKKGYIIIPGGIRIGVCGRALTNGDSIVNVFDIDSLNIRIPYPVYGICGKIYERLRSASFCTSVLIYSPPGGGKTTMIRDLAFRLASEAERRISVIDSRCEIADSRLRLTDNTDIYTGYPKAYAIELATRTMNPEYIICDEVGAYDEALALLSVQSAGVPVIATAHASNVVELVKRRNIALLCENALFDLYVGIRRSRENKLSFSFCTGEEVASL